MSLKSIPPLDCPHLNDEYLLLLKQIGRRTLAKKWNAIAPSWTWNGPQNLSTRGDWQTQRRQKQDKIRDRAISMAVTQISDYAAKRIREGTPEPID
jgi:hypothetical protein